MKRVKILCVVGTRPNFMKVAPLHRALRNTAGMEPILVHTGQHFDARMSQVFFQDLGLPMPDINLGINAGSPVERTAEIMKSFERVLLDTSPHLVLVVGDVDSTFACAFTAVKMGVRVAHVEAGLRSFDRSMPEEINRILTDSICQLLFVTERSGVENLRREGVDEERIFLVGNVMIDTLLQHRSLAAASGILKQLGVGSRQYALVTLHRPGNVDEKSAFRPLLSALREIQESLPIVFPMHPRTRKNIERFGLEAELAGMRNLHCIEPLGYLDFLFVMENARIVLTDSGGVQEETTVLGVPCLTLRENTERPITIAQGTNQLVGCNQRLILAAFSQVMKRQHENKKPLPDLWDGHAADRIVTVLKSKT